MHGSGKKWDKATLVRKNRENRKKLEKKSRKTLKFFMFSQALCGHISKSFHRISKIPNSVGRSGAWLSDQKAGQVKV